MTKIPTYNFFYKIKHKRLGQIKSRDEKKINSDDLFNNKQNNF